MARVARLGIVIESSGAKRGAQETNSALGSIDQTAQRTVKSLQQAAAALGVAFGIRALQQAVDQYTLLDARLRQVTGSGANFARVQQQLFTIAQSSRSSYAATIDLYTKLARSSDQLGLSQGQLVSVTESVSAAVRLSNATTGAAEASLVQLGQAFASGTLRGDELRSIMEQLPAVAKAIADGLGVPIGKLREMGEAGELSGRRVALALESQREKLALLAGEIPTTIGQALQQLNNAFGLVVAGSTEAKSATAGIAGVIGEAARFMVEYRDAVVAVSVAIGTGGLVLAAGKATAALAATSGGAALRGLLALVPAVTSLSASFAFLQLAAGAAWTAITGPIGLAVIGITAVAAAVYAWRTRQKETTEAVKATTQSAEDLYAAAKRMASANWAPPEMLKQIENLGGELRAAQQGGKQSAEAFRTAAEQWKDSGDKARTFAQALAEGDTRAKTLMSTASALTQMQGQLAAATDRQSAATKAASKAAEERAAIEREYSGQWVALAIELEERKRAATEASTTAATASATALRLLTSTRQADVEQMDLQIAALLKGEGAYLTVARAQARQAAVAEALRNAQQAGVQLTLQSALAVAAQALEEEKRRKVLEALLSLDGKNAGTIPIDNATKQTNTLVESVRDLLGVAQLVGQAFGDIGRTIAQAATGAQSIATGLQRAGSIKNSAGASVGIGGALRGEAGTAGVVAGLGAAGAVIGGLAQISDSLDLFGTRARERARVLREAADAFNKSLDAFAQGTRGSLEDQLRQNLAQARELAAQAVKIRGGTPTTVQSADDLTALVAELERAASQSKLFEAALRPLIDQLRLLDTVTRQNEQAIKGQADAAREAKDASIAAAAAAREVAQAEDLRRRALTRDGFNSDVTARRQQLDGDGLGALLTTGSAAQRNQLAEADALARAGIITAEAFEALRQVLNDELIASVQAFTEAAKRAAQQVQDDLAVRALVAQGLDEEAAQKRREIANRNELRDVTDEGLRAQILYVQGLEAEAIAKAALAEEAAKVTRAIEEQTRANKEADRIATEAWKRRQEENAASQQSLADRQADLGVRTLRAAGNAAGADALAIEIANRRELMGVTDENLRAQILYVQGLEHEARVRATVAAEAARLAEEAAARQDRIRDINRRFADALRVLDPAMAAELDRKALEIERAKELEAATTDAMRARLNELFAMQDAAAAHIKLTQELERQTAAAQRLASFTSSVEVDYLRATGRTFEADRLTLTEDRDRRLREAKEVGAAQSVIDMINATFDAKLSALIAAQMAPTSRPGSAGPFGGGSTLAPALRENSVPTLGGDSTTFRGGASITETSAMRLIDYAASQLAVQREILAEMRGRRGVSTDAMAMPSSSIERILGAATYDQALLVGGRLI